MCFAFNTFYVHVHGSCRYFLLYYAESPCTSVYGYFLYELFDIYCLEEPRGWEGERMNQKILHLQQCRVNNRIQAFAGNSRGACGSCQIGLLYCCQVRQDIGEA